MGQHPWYEGGPRKNKNLKKACHSTHKEVSICQIAKFTKLCEDLSSENLKSLLLTVLSSVSCFLMTTSWLCNCKNTACKLFQKEPYLYFLKDCIITLILSTSEVRLYRADRWPKPANLELKLTIVFIPLIARHNTNCLIEARSLYLKQN